MFGPTRSNWNPVEKGDQFCVVSAELNGRLNGDAPSGLPSTDEKDN